MSQIEVTVLADSISPDGARLTTFELLYHRYILAEVNTHRVLSKNTASSRAIPSSKLLEIVEDAPMLPISVGKNQAGMQASQNVEDDIAARFIDEWKHLGKTVAAHVKILQSLGAHKQIVNRPLEAFLPVRTVLTGTDFDNYFDLRDSEFAQPEFKALAKGMREAVNKSTPKLLQPMEWHLPYITTYDTEYVANNYTSDEANYWQTLCFISAARCARVSHALGGLTTKTIEEEIQKGKDLVTLKHSSPLEHIATPWNVTDHIPVTDDPDDHYSNALFELTKWLSTPNASCPAWADVRNFRGWRQLRSFIEHNAITL